MEIKKGKFIVDDVIEAKSPVRKSNRDKKKILKQLKDSHPFMTTIKYKKMKVNHGGEVYICVFLIAIKLNKPN